MGLKVEVGVAPLGVVVWAVEETEEVLVDLVEGENMLDCFHLTFSFVWSVLVKRGIITFV